MDSLLPWKKLERQLAKKYSAGRAGRKPYPFKVMLGVHVMQLLYNLSDPAMEDALYEIESMRRFAELRLL
jgi:IS5 family transposase